MTSATTTLTHRRETSNIETGYVTLFAEDGNEHYGVHLFRLDSDLPAVTDELVAWTAEYYGIDSDEARDLVDPADIVDSAGAWDDNQFASDLWQAMEACQVEMVAGYRTQDGAVVLDREDAQITYLGEVDPSEAE